MLRRLLSRKGVSEAERESMLASVEERGSAYLPQVNAFYVREFQMTHAAEDATRFLHQACQGLPHRLNGHSRRSSATQQGSANDRHTAIDNFYARVIEHAVAYFGSRVLYPSRPAPDDSIAAVPRCLRESGAGRRSMPTGASCESAAQDLGYRIGNQIYDAYLAGKVAPSGLRRLFLAHLDEPGAGPQSLHCGDCQTACSLAARASLTLSRSRRKPISFAR